MSLSHITLHLTVAKSVSVFRFVGRKKLVGGRVLSKLRKHSAKIFFGVSCFLLALSLGFSAYSFAKYVSHVDLDSDGAVVAPIECGFTVDNNGLGSFINAPYMSQITENTQAVRMNSWAESIITLDNHGSHGFSYEYGFAFYLQKDFAESAMFQLLELDSPPSARETQSGRKYSVKKASALSRNTKTSRCT